MERVDLRNLTLSETEELVKSLGAPSYRASQVFDWVYKGKTDFREMSNLPEVFRERLSEAAYIGTLRTLRAQESKTDGTRKFLFGLSDGNAIETVFMKYNFGNSVCVSSQAGCRMGCKFCASTKKGLERGLTAGEIVSEILAAEAETGERIGHVVVMGTGEPFDNYDNVAKFIRIINEKKGLSIGMRNITVSTCGIVPMIDRFGDDFDQVNLAISLHAPEDDMRSSMMPINKRYPLGELIPACRRYTEKTGRRITFEYTLVSGVNDSDACISELAALLRGMLCHVNLIPLNAVKGTGMKTVPRKRAAEIASFLEQKGIPATVRRELGSDIDAACGQLRLNTNYSLNENIR
ncbi:MAG: 23S rRNA (adenine(2503)-C(2))-methyltransferase RlmN [Eubacterium sp.]|jgi:23S rRNA (adenine2503-C2)-methyltransferase